MAYSLNQHLAYNTWANERFAALLAGVDDSIYFQNSKSSFNSIAETVLHIWGAQVIWLNRIQGDGSATRQEADFKNNKAESLDNLVRSSEKLAQFVSSKSESFLSSMYTYRNLKGAPCEDRYEDTLYHIVNHSTYHRGQIVTMLREAGETTLPSTDLILYVRGLKK